jgi:hypothetical protein
MKTNDISHICPFSRFETHWSEGMVRYLSIECKQGEREVVCNPFSKSCLLLELLIKMKDIYENKEKWFIRLMSR